MYSSATPMSAELFQRGRRQGIGHIIIYQSLQPSFSTLLQMATNAGVLHVTVINYTGDLGKVESNLQQFDSFSILREVGANEEVAEEEVAAANHLLDLLADDTRRGSLEFVELPKVDFTDSQIKPFFFREPLRKKYGIFWEFFPNVGFSTSE